MIYLFEFFVFAFLGWIVDSIYHSITIKKIVISGYFRGVPLCPIYGFGGILLLNSFAFLSDQPFWLTILITTILIVTFEFFGGKLTEHFLGERLWDYSKEFLNLNGYISLWHSFLWLIGTSISYLIIGHKVNLIIDWFKSKLIINPNLEVIIMFVILIFGFWLIIHNKKLRLSKLLKNNSKE